MAGPRAVHARTGKLLAEELEVPRTFLGRGIGLMFLRSLARVRSAVAYDGPIELAIQRFKYQGWRRLAAPLALLLVERLVVECLAASWAVAVPLHPERQWARGFNQSELLAAELRARMSLERPPGQLVRARATPPQVGHDR